MQPRGSLVSFRPATTGQVGDVLVVLDEVAAWLASLGVQQWPHRFDSAWVLPAIEEGHTASDEDRYRILSEGHR